MTQPPEARFSAADLEPSLHDRRLARAARIEVAAAGLATLTVGLWVGGRVALGACAAPFVFRMVPAPLSGDVMAAAFARLDTLALGGAAFVLALELLRTVVSLRRKRTVAVRLRRITGVALAGVAAYFAVALTPTIRDLHAHGARRGAGEEGARLEAAHQRATRFGQLELLLGVALMGLHLGTLRSTHPWHQEEEEDAPEPAPPGSPVA